MQPTPLLYQPRTSLPVYRAASQTPFCFGKEYDRTNPACMGGFDLDFTDEETGNIRGPCFAHAQCAIAMGDKEPTPAPASEIVVPTSGLPRVNLGNVPQPSMAGPSSERNVMYPSPYPVTAPPAATTPAPQVFARPPSGAGVVVPKPVAPPLPVLNSPEWNAMMERLHRSGQQADENARAAAAAAAAVPPPIAGPLPYVPPGPPIPPAPAYAMPPPSPPITTLPPIRPTFAERIAPRANAFVNTMQQVTQPLAAPPPPTPLPGGPAYPSQVYGAATTYQLNYGMPGYLSSPEPQHPGESLWHVFLRELLRAVGKALGHAIAHFFDTRGLRPV